ncbi:hypothetical protein AB0P21_12880 [Kribbella sp. NPDC056861]|uniref:hypothetical protein n=1 Tax=Kribbella sp. NPDC056861 TaxID=3154857 RepID=UPI0034310678
MDDLLAVAPETQLVYDPFAGSGTVMLESLYRGLDFHGSDINPLAILLCQVKATPPTLQHALDAAAVALRVARGLTDPEVPNFPGIDKWFKPEIRDGLARLRHGILAVEGLDDRRFLWICLAETIRLVSNSRISTFKLHVYPEEEVARRESDAIKVYDTVTRQNVRRLRDHWIRMSSLDQHRSAPSALLLPGSVTDQWIAPRRADVLMTSPPYGDNQTTVPYGQHSYLPLQWIASADLPGAFDPSLLESTHRIDSLSLGGSLKHADEARDNLCAVSPALDGFLAHIVNIPPLRKKVLSFVRDYHRALDALRPRLMNGAFCFLTLGERRVGKQTFPLVEITKELLTASGHEYVTTIERVLPGSHKRMAARNSEGATMAQEWILVTRSWTAARG